MKPPLHVFVVMPFGTKPLGDKRKRTLNFNAVYEDLLAPALKQAGCIAFRADQEAAAGDIRIDMFYELVSADVVVADMSMLNPNVFYEVGVRDMATRRGAILISAHGTERPFDKAMDRHFHYDAAPYLKNAPASERSPKKLQAAIDKLASTLKEAIAQQDERDCSPVFAHLKELQPADVSRISSGAGRSLGMTLEDLEHKVDEASKLGRPGEILTLAQTAPTRELRRKLTRTAAKALISMRHFSGALRVLDQHRADVRDDIEMDSLRGLALNRLGHDDEAKVALDKLWAEHANSPETAGMLGRVYKDRWRSQFERLVPSKRKLAAASGAALADATRSFECYLGAARAKLNAYYVAVNALAMGRLLQHVRKTSLSRAQREELDDLHAAAHCAVRQCLGALKSKRGTDAVWCHATQGELALLGAASAREAAAHYRLAHAAEPTPFEVDSMLGQLELYASLAWRPDVVDACMKELEGAVRATPRLFKRVAVCSGHMIDQPGRKPPRFPPEREAFVQAKIAERLAAWALGPDDLAVCGGARGADILFAEEALKRGAKVRLLRAQPEAAFRRDSLQLGKSDFSWETRFDALVTAGAEVRDRHLRLGNPPAGVSIYEQTNRWILNTAATTAAGEILGLLVWDGNDAGDGPGGTAHFQRELKSFSCTPVVIDPSP